MTAPNSRSRLIYRDRIILHTTTVYILQPLHSLSSSAKPWITATVDGDLRHPLTTKLTHYNLPNNFLSKLKPTTLAVSHYTSYPHDKLIVVATANPKLDNIPNYITRIDAPLDDCTLLALRNGGQLRGYSPLADQWVGVSGGGTDDMFDDVVILLGKIYAVDREGRLYLINISPKSREVSIAKTLIDEPVAPASGWRKRLVVRQSRLYLVVRLEEKLFKVCLLSSEGNVNLWAVEVGGFCGDVLFMARDYYFFSWVRRQSEFLGRKFRDCIVFSEGAFPQYGNGCWELPQFGDVTRSEEDIAVFRVGDDGSFAREGENDVFPKIDWSPPAWISQACSDLAAQTRSPDSERRCFIAKEIEERKTMTYKRKRETNKMTTPKTLGYHNRIILHTTTIFILEPPHPSSSSATTTAKPWITATVDGVLRHPLTTKLTHYNLPSNLDLSKLNPTTLAVSHNTSSPHDKLLVVPTENPKFDNNLYCIFAQCTLLSLCNGGQLQGYSCCADEWVSVSGGGTDDMFDDIEIFKGKIYAVDREGRLYLINISPKPRKFSIGKTLIDKPVAPGSRWRKRLVVHESYLHLVVRLEEKLFKVCSLSFVQNVNLWEVEGFCCDVLFMARDYYFFSGAQRRSEFPGRMFRDCIVFSEGAFPQYGNGCWELPQFGDVRRSEEDIAVFRVGDGSFAREGENDLYSKIDWSPPAWISQAWSDLAAQTRSPDSERELEADRDQKDGEVQSDSKNSNNKPENDGEMQSDLIGQDKEQEGMTSGSDIQDRDGIMQCDLNSEKNEDEEVTRTLVSINGGNGQGTLMKNITQLLPRACTSSTTKSRGSDGVTTKFEGFDVISDFVPTLQMIWRNHGNIIENSSIRSGVIIARALESLATVVRMLEDISAQSLSGSQADFLSSTLSDLRYMHFKVCWLIPFVEKALKLHKSKHLVDSLNNLSQLCSQFKKRRIILVDKLTKLGEEEDKVKEEMVKVSKMIPFSRQAEFEKPVGSGLT